MVTSALATKRMQFLEAAPVFTSRVLIHVTWPARQISQAVVTTMLGAAAARHYRHCVQRTSVITVMTVIRATAVWQWVIDSNTAAREIRRSRDDLRILLVCKARS